MLYRRSFILLAVSSISSLLLASIFSILRSPWESAPASMFTSALLPSYTSNFWSRNKLEYLSQSGSTASPYKKASSICSQGSNHFQNSLQSHSFDSVRFFIVWGSSTCRFWAATKWSLRITWAGKGNCFSQGNSVHTDNSFLFHWLRPFLYLASITRAQSSQVSRTPARENGDF